MEKRAWRKGGSLRERILGLLLGVPSVGSLRERFFGIEYGEIQMRIALGSGLRATRIWKTKP
jgi:hypothetical protein